MLFRSNNRDVIVNGFLKDPIEELTGVIGLNRLETLKGLLSHTSFSDDSATIEMKTREIAGVATPAELKFLDSENQQASYRFMNAEVLPKDITFKGKWDISVSPSTSKIRELMAMGNLLSKSDELYYQVRTIKGDLRFYMGDEDSCSTYAFVTVDKTLKQDKSQVLNAGFFWPIANVNSTLKVAMNRANFVMKFSSLGALMISFDTDLGSYEVILPARKK